MEYNSDSHLVEEGYISHPCGIKPNGNYYFDSFNKDFYDSKTYGLGLFSMFEDHFLLSEIMDWMTPSMLTTMAQVSKAWYLFVQDEEQWKIMVIRDFGANFRFNINWQYTYKQASNPSFQCIPKPLQVKYFYSDYLFHIWRCTSVDMKRWEYGETIERRAGLTLEQFTSEYLIPNKPVILTDAMDGWPAKKWTRESLVERCGDTKFYINSGVFMTMKEYMNYANQVQEESPMYLFDHYYGENQPDLLQDYNTDKYFKEDYFEVLGKDRPSFRWLLVGPPRSGATFHKDPNHTSAFNGVITGRKKWVMYPPHVTPPGVYPSDDGLEVTTPHSIIEWFINYYDNDVRELMDADKKKQQGKSKKKSKSNMMSMMGDDGKKKKVERMIRGKNQMTSNDNDSTKQQKQYNEDGEEQCTVKPLECILNPGEMIYVPCGWWHTVLNLEESIAVTHNFINSHNIVRVLEFMSTKKSKHLHDLFKVKFEEAYPGRLDKIIEEQKERDRISGYVPTIPITKQEGKENESNQQQPKKQSIWEKIDPNQQSNNNNTEQQQDNNISKSSFSFNFTISED